MKEDRAAPPERPHGRVRLLPEWFDVDWLVANLVGSESELNAARTLANSLLLESARRRSVRRVFQF